MTRYPGLLACPRCGGLLEVGSGFARCPSCERTYPETESGGYDLRCEDLLGDEAPRWRDIQERGAIHYRTNPASNCSRWLADGKYARLFGRFCALNGLVLDVGCGPRGPYLPPGSGPVELIGVDPLPASETEFETHRALAEYLPFRSGSFDHVIMISSIDHMAEPRRAAREAYRVLRPGGEIHIWTHVHAPQSARARVLMRNAARRLADPRRWASTAPSLLRAVRFFRRGPTEADDLHMTLFDLSDARRMLEDAGFSVLRDMACDEQIFFVTAARPAAGRQVSGTGAGG